MTEERDGKGSREQSLNVRQTCGGDDLCQKGQRPPSPKEGTRHYGRRGTHNEGRDDVVFLDCLDENKVFSSGKVTDRHKGLRLRIGPSPRRRGVTRLVVGKLDGRFPGLTSSTTTRGPK